MSESDLAGGSSEGYRVPRHRQVLHVLEMMDAEFLAGTRCWFGGGTRIVLELDEYRESIDIDFLCADRDGYRAIRSVVTNRSFGALFREPPELLRDIRADRYGVRTYLLVGGKPLKIEIVSEGRIPLGATSLAAVPVPVLDRVSCLAEKLLANADRGRDESTLSRDLVDLAFMLAGWSDTALSEALERATSAYGQSILRELAATLALFDRADYRARCLSGLAITDEAALDTGLSGLRNLVSPG